MDADPKVFVISGPSGVGKGTLTAELLKRVPSLVRSISVTTRRPRPGEINGVDYYFITDDEFDEQVKKGNFLEWAQVHSNRYGTLRTMVLQKLAEGKDVVLVIDVQGAAKIKSQMPESILIFIKPPSMEELIKRLRGRNTETEEDLDRRIKNALGEIELAKNYDYVVINDDVSRAADELISIVQKERGNS